MSKLSEPLKALINASHAKPNTLPAPRHISSVYERIANEAGSKQVGLPAWLTASVSSILPFSSALNNSNLGLIGGGDVYNELSGFTVRTL